MQFDLNQIRRPKTFTGEYLWPNELTQYKDKTGANIMLIPDGFLMPGQDDGGIYAIRNPQDRNAKPVRVTGHKSGWFYHRAQHVTLPGGEEGILTARAKKSLIGKGEGELVWLSIPKDFGIDNSVSAVDRKPKAWSETVLATGPDVMFEIVDLDDSDDCVEVVATHFFGRKLSVHSLRATEFHPFVEIIKSSTIDTIGRPYGLCLATLTPNENSESKRDFSRKRKQKIGGDNRGTGNALKRRFRYKSKKYMQSYHNEISKETEYFQVDESCDCDNSNPTHLLVTTHECSYDIPSAIDMLFSAIDGAYPRIKCRRGETAMALKSDDNQKDSVIPGYGESIPGGALLAYEIPLIRKGLNNQEDSKITEGVPKFRPLSSWTRHTLFQGFKVRGWGGIFSPGAPGFPYVFRMPRKPQVNIYLLIHLFTSFTLITN